MVRSGHLTQKGIFAAVICQRAHVSASCDEVVLVSLFDSLEQREASMPSVWV